MIQHKRNFQGFGWFFKIEDNSLSTSRVILQVEFPTEVLTKIFVCRFVMTALELLGKLVDTFGPIIHATRTSAPSIGVDLQAEQR